MSLPRYIDLHSHTTESDGSYTPEELIDLAVRTDLQALAITDHDTFSGYEMALPFARKAGLDLVRGIELNSRLNLTNSDDSRAAHLLGLFPSREPSEEFINWIEDQRSDRRERNRKLAETLQERGVKVTLEEAEARGRNLTSRTHFAQILIEKGYVNSFDEAFREYLGEDAPSYVARQSLTSEEVIRRIRSGGGVSVVAHPVRLSLSRDAERQELVKLKEAGLAALEIYHSDQDPQLQAYYHQLAQELDLLPTGGSDFHGRLKPDIDLGTGLRGNVRVPFEFLQRLREFAP
ncbi:MAG: PHP domain-containing protein [Acidobacteriaceae bacterium]|nr:PHP domain-containing protein [Acidobacteriaceae bacterium]